MSKARKIIAMQRERAVAAEETYTALSEMEENLRRLGLREELDGVSANSTQCAPPRVQPNFSSEYLASIRKSREEAAKLRYEKEYRQFASEEQRRENELMLAAVNESKALLDVIEKAQGLLRHETLEAEALSVRRMRGASERAFRAQHLDRMRTVSSRARDAEAMSRRDNNSNSAAFLAACSAGAAVVAPFFDASLPVPSAKARAKAAATRAYCERMAYGLVELVVRVADNQYGPDGVRRVPQDLAVTQWNAWVDALLFAPQRPVGDVLEATTLRELRDPRTHAQLDSEEEVVEQEEQQKQQKQLEEEENEEDEQQQEHKQKQEKEKEPQEQGEGREGQIREERSSAAAVRVLHRVSSLSAAHNASLVARSVADATRQLRAAEFAHIHRDLNALRNAGIVLPEAVPGWARRLPPVAAVVFGDELSGARAIADAALRSTDSTAGQCRVIVPSMLARAPASMAVATAASGGSGGGGAGGGGGGGGAGAKGLRRADTICAAGITRGKQTDEMTEIRVYYETLSDALVWEMIAVYQHNCLTLARAAIAAAAAAAAAAAEAEAAKAQEMAQTESFTPSSREFVQIPHARIDEGLPDSPSSTGCLSPCATAPLRSLLLLCFPEADTFWRIFIPRLSAAVERAELEMEQTLRSDACPEAEVPERPSRGRQNARGKQSRAQGAAVKPNTKGARRGQSPVAQANNETDVPPRAFAFPPLCITGVFLQCDIPERFVRLRGAVHSAAGLHHPALSPDPAHSSPCPDEDASLSRSSSPHGHLHAPTAGAESCGDWPMDRVRRELVEQDRRMHQMWNQWAVAVARGSVTPDADPDKQAPPEGKKRPRPGQSAKSSDSSRHMGAHSPAPPAAATQPLALSLPLSLVNAAAKSTTVNFPRVLFFRRRADMSSLQRHTTLTETVEALMDALCPRSGAMCVRSAQLVPGLLPAPLRMCDYRLAPALLTQLVETYARATARWEGTAATAASAAAAAAAVIVTTPTTTTTATKAAAAAAGAAAATTTTAATPNTTTTTVPIGVHATAAESPLTTRAEGVDRSSENNSVPFHGYGNSSDTCGDDDDNAVWAEMEVFRAFRGLATDLLRFMNDVFPPSLWDSGACGPDGFSRTTHFTAVDRNYESSREALYELLADGSARLVAVCALLLRYTADMALRHVADALVRVCGVVRRHMDSSAPAQNEVRQPSLPTPSLRDGQHPESPSQQQHQQQHHPQHQQQHHQQQHQQQHHPQHQQQHHQQQQQQQHHQQQDDHGDPGILKSFDCLELPSALCVPATSEWTAGCFSASLASLEQLREHFVASVPRLSHAEAETMITQLGGQSVTLDAFRLALRAYATRVEHVVTDCFRRFLYTTCTSMDPDALARCDSMAPQIARTLLSYLFATGEKEDESDIPRVSVSLSRVSALVHVIRRCFTVAGRGAARWIDTMYVAALAVPPQGTFPPHRRPVNISSVLAPPAPVVQRNGAPPLSLALERVETIAPPLGLSNAEECECWRETEVEIMLQCFSIYQKSQLDEAEFTHCVLLTQISELWPFLPSRAHELAARVNYTEGFIMDHELCDDEIGDGVILSAENVFSLSTHFLTRERPCRTESVFPHIVSEVDIARLFRWTLRAQQQRQPDGKRRMSTDFVTSSSSLFPSRSLPLPHAPESPMPCRHARALSSTPASPPRIALREFFIDALLQRCCFNDAAASASECPCRANAVREPSASELRALVRSLPRAVWVQRHNVPARGAPITAEEWAHVKWWPFCARNTDPNKDEANEAHNSATGPMGPFERRILLRVLTMCFAFADAALCVRCVPFLPDVIALAARTCGSQATVERYFHALVALHSPRDGDDDDDDYDDENNYENSNNNNNNKTAEEVENSLGVAATPANGRQLALFRHGISVEEALFFFHGAGDAALRGPCLAAGGHLLPDQRVEGDAPLCTAASPSFPAKAMATQSPTTVSAMAGAEEEDAAAAAAAAAAEGAMPLATELALLLEAEAAAELTLPLLGASHWGRRLVPRLAAVPQGSAPVCYMEAAGETEEGTGAQEELFLSTAFQVEGE